MGRSVRISEEAAKNFDRAARLGCGPDRFALNELHGALARLDRIPKRLRKPRDLTDALLNAAVLERRAQRSRKPSKEEKKDETAVIRAACFARVESAGGMCECGCGLPVRDDDKDAGCYPEARGDLDHFFGRGKVRQSTETCWILRAGCHREKTLNRPDAATWLRKFSAHCDRNAAVLGLGDLLGQTRAEAKKRLAFVETRSNLPAAPRTR